MVGAAGGGMNYRGEWTSAPVTPYAIDDVVVMPPGASAGTYISVLATNTNNPATGIGWVQLSSLTGANWT